MTPKIFVTADHHFYHSNVIKLCDRGFKDQDEMHEFMIDAWNSHVTSRDTIYHLGDFSMANFRSTISILSRLNGQIKFIRGNHDRRWYTKISTGTRFEFLGDIHTLRHQGRRLVLSHYPLLEWDGYYRGYKHLHGHTHGNIPDDLNIGRMDVGVDNVGYVPLDLDTILDRLGD